MPQILSIRRLVRGFVLLNVVLLLLLLSCFVGAHPWLGFAVPGRFDGVFSSGVWVILSFALLANVAAFLAVGFVVIFPALLDGVGIDERKLTKLLTDRAGISRDALDACIAVIRAEAAAARRRLALGRAMIIGGALALILAFTAVCMALAQAGPHKPLFTRDAQLVDSTTVTEAQIWRFTGDQIAGALALDFPELYDFHFGDLDNNVQSRIFTDFVFAFRAILGWVALTSIIVTIRAWRSTLRPPKR